MNEKLAGRTIVIYTIIRVVLLVMFPKFFITTTLIDMLVLFVLVYLYKKYNLG